MIDAPHCHKNVPEVAPGDRIYTDEHGVVLVDEIRRGMDGFSFVGWPAHRAGTGRRVAVAAVEDGIASVLATDDDMPDILRALGYMTDSANRHEQGNDPGGVSDDPGEYTFRAFPHPVLTLRARGTLWTLPLAMSQPVEPTAAPDPAPVVADPPEVD